MEHNEEALVRVYQEKERQYKEQIAELRQKLQVSQQGETALRQQLCNAEQQRHQMQNSIQTLNNDKQTLTRKVSPRKNCQKLDLFNILQFFQNFSKKLA